MTPDDTEGAPGAGRTSSQHARHAASGAIKSFGAGLIVIPVGLVSAVFVTRILGPEKYGLLAVTFAIMMWFEVTVGLWLGRIAVRLIADAKDWQQVAARLTQAQLFLGLAGGAVMFASAGLIAGILRSPELTGLIRLAALDVPLATMGGMFAAVLNGTGRFGERAALVTLYWLSRLVLVVALVALNPSVEAAIAAIVGASLIMLMRARFLVRERLFVRSSYPWQRIWEFAWPVFLVTVAGVLFASLDLLFVQALVPQPEDAGYLGSARNLTILPGMFAAALSPVLMAKLTELPRLGQVDTANIMARRALRLALCMLPFAAMTAGAADEIATLIYGQPYADSGPLLAILIFSSVGASVTGLASAMLIAAGRPRLPLVYVVPQLVVAFGVYWLVTSRFGTMGAVVTTTALVWLGTSAALLTANTQWRILPLWPTLLRCLAISIAAFAAAWFWPTSGVLVVVKVIVVSGLILIGLRAIGEVTRNDVSFARSLVKRAPESA